MMCNSPQAAASCSHSSGSSGGVGPEPQDDAVNSQWTYHARAVLPLRGNAAFHNRRSNYPAPSCEGGLGGKVPSLTNDLLMKLSSSDTLFRVNRVSL